MSLWLPLSIHQQKKSCPSKDNKLSSIASKKSEVIQNQHQKYELASTFNESDTLTDTDNQAMGTSFNVTYIPTFSTQDSLPNTFAYT